MPIDVDPEERRELGARVKAELRDRMRRVRHALGADLRAARSERIAKHVIALPAWSRAGCVALFVPMRTEVDVTFLERAAREDGKRIAAPRMVPDHEGDPVARWNLHLHLWEDGVEMVESGHMVKEPPSSAPRVAGDEVDLVIVPALALDPRGARLGYGAGQYDRLLPHLPRARRVAVAFDFQLLAEIPENEHDQRVHTIVTDERVLECE